MEVKYFTMLDLCMPIGTHGNEHLLDRLKRTKLEDKDFLIILTWKYDV
jgi:hypothetical protein